MEAWSLTMDGNGWLFTQPWRGPKLPLWQFGSDVKCSVTVITLVEENHSLWRTTRRHLVKHVAYEYLKRSMLVWLLSRDPSFLTCLLFYQLLGGCCTSTNRLPLNYLEVVRWPKTMTQGIMGKKSRDSRVRTRDLWMWLPNGTKRSIAGQSHVEQHCVTIADLAMTTTGTPGKTNICNCT